jgi:hypothetical protein
MKTTIIIDDANNYHFWGEVNEDGKAPHLLVPWGDDDAQQEAIDSTFAEIGIKATDAQEGVVYEFDSPDFYLQCEYETPPDEVCKTYTRKIRNNQPA